MSLKGSISMLTRISDLDSLRHLNNRNYERFCSEGRYRLLEAHGYSIEALLEKAITLRPVATFVKFSAQQKSGSTLNTQTEAFPLENGIIFWDHHISQPYGTAVCHLQARTQTLDRRQQPVDLLPLTGERLEEVLIEDVPAFSGNCSRITSLYSANYTDMDVFGSLPIAAFWRIFEEGRHMFGEQLGLTLEKLVQMDTHIFWMAGTYQFYKPIIAGQKIRIQTWLERIVRIRAIIRQEIRSADGSELVGASREEHLIVSLKRARPKTPPVEFINILQDYIAYQD